MIRRSVRAGVWTVGALSLGLLLGGAARRATPDTPSASPRPPTDAAPALAVADPFATLGQENIDKPASEKQGLLEAEARRAILRPEEVARTLGVGPGMSVLDLGAGSGLFTIPFAEALEGRGEVWATDIEPDMLALVQAAAEERGLDEVRTVLVTGPGLDPFYAERCFDRVLMSSVFEFLPDPVSFMGELRRSLRPGARLALIQGLVREGFLPDDFFDNLRVDVLLLADPRHPVLVGLPPDLLAEALDTPTPLPLELRRRLSDAFDDLLDDPTFYVSWRSHKRSLGVDPEVLLQSFLFEDELRLLRFLELSFDWRVGSGPMQLAAARTLARLALTEVIERDGLARRFTSGLGLYSSERGIERRMAAAGYRLVETSSALASHSFQVFEPVDAPCTTPPATTP